VLELAAPQVGSLALTFGNTAGDTLRLGYDAPTARWWIDRRAAGIIDFHPAFAAHHSAPRWAAQHGLQCSVWFDRSSVEVFADGGLSTLTSLHFPRAPWSTATLQAEGLTLSTLSLQALRSP
jgi:fructan beta-fructosidase